LPPTGAKSGNDLYFIIVIVIIIIIIIYAKLKLKFTNFDFHLGVLGLDESDRFPRDRLHEADDGRGALFSGLKKTRGWFLISPPSSKCDPQGESYPWGE
jgi:hypothetical protein